MELDLDPETGTALFGVFDGHGGGLTGTLPWLGMLLVEASKPRVGAPLTNMCAYCRPSSGRLVRRQCGEALQRGRRARKGQSVCVWGAGQQRVLRHVAGETVLLNLCAGEMEIQE